MRAVLWTAVLWSLCVAGAAVAEEKAEPARAAEEQVAPQAASPATEASAATADEATPAEPSAASTASTPEEAAPASQATEPAPAAAEPSRAEEAARAGAPVFRAQGVPPRLDAGNAAGEGGVPRRASASLWRAQVPLGWRERIAEAVVREELSGNGIPGELEALGRDGHRGAGALPRGEPGDRGEGPRRVAEGATGGARDAGEEGAGLATQAVPGAARERGQGAHLGEDAPCRGEHEGNRQARHAPPLGPTTGPPVSPARIAAACEDA